MRQEPSSQPRPRAPISSPEHLPPGAQGSTPIQVPRWAYPLVTVAALLIGAAAIVRETATVASVTDSDLTNFFFKSANYILMGDPWQMYAAHGSGLTATYPNYNPPLSIFLMAPLLGLARTIGFAASYGQQITFVSLPFIIFVPLLGYLVLRVLALLYPQIPETQRLLAFMLVVLSPLTWQSIATWYHLEQPMMLCFLVASLFALQIRREGLAGVLAGLAVLSRTTALFPLIAIGLLLLLAKQWRSLFTFGGVAALVGAIGVAPFFLFDRRDATYAFVSWRGTAEIGSNSIWTIFAYNGHGSSLRHLLDAAARRLDAPSVVIFVLIVTFFAVRRYRVSAYAPDAWAVAAIAALAVPMLSKTVWPYYYLEPFILLLVWEFATLHNRRAGVWRWPVLSFGFLVVAATLSQYIGLHSVGALDRISVGLLNFAAMLGFAIALWLRMGAAKPASTSIPQAVAAGVYSPPPGVDPRLAVQGAGSGQHPPREWPPAVAPAAPTSQAAPRVSPMGDEPSGAPGHPQPPQGWPAAAPEGTPPRESPVARPSAASITSNPELPEEWPDLDAAWPPSPRDRG